jgi:lysophospholipase L1-like esterase
MRSALCFGDSNTYGQIPGKGPLDRYGTEIRWPGAMRKHLGSKWLVIEEGLSGRTTLSDDPIEGAHKNGRTYLKPCIQSHAPLDLIILMLGTNDLKIRFNKPASEIAMAMGVLVYDIKELLSGPGGRVPEIMIVAPAPVHKDLKEWKTVFAGAYEKSRQLALEYEMIADSLEVHFFDAGSVVTCSKEDGFHLDAQAHEALGKAIAQEVEAIGWAREADQ